MRWALVFGGLFVHVVFFYSIFDIYFTSPLTQGMTPHQNPLPPPADRLVLFVADGLRADKLFELKEDGTSRAPFLREKVERDGAWGVSHTRVPTESRPGHVALIAGFYEDVSAVAKGWKENPVEFDSVFNQSRYTWSWGSPDILPMFAKGATGDHVFTKMYPGASEDFAGSDLHKLDDWVFDNVKNFLLEAKSDAELEDRVRSNKIVLFMHLLGLDTNGHAHKPYSEEYLQNIEVVDRGIADLSAVIEDFYGHDKRTAYVFSADHGMTNWGSHGAGHPSETLTPLVAWGAGIRGAKPASRHFADNFNNDWKLEKLERVDVNQADICPLMAALVGIPYPLNSVGTLPLDYLDVTAEFKAESIFTNALEILEQFQIKMREKQETTLAMLFTPFKSLLPSTQADMVRNIRSLIHSGHIDDAIKDSQQLITLALQGLNYYHNYDRFFLGVSIALGFLGWMAYVLTMVLRTHTTITQHHPRLDSFHGPLWASEKGIRLIFILLGVVICLLLYVQSLPWTHYLYCLLPVVLWHKVAQRSSALRDLWWYTRDHALLTQAAIMTVLGVAGLEIIVMSFFRRELMSIGLVGMGVWPFFTPLKDNNRTVVGWLCSCVLVAIFPVLPVVGRDSNYSYVILAGIVAVVFAVIFIISPEKLGLRSKSAGGKSLQRVKLLTWFQVVILLVSVYSVYKTSSSLSRREGLPLINQVLSWAILVSSFIQPMLSSSKMLTRLVSISLAFTAPYILLSTSHEGLFLISLCILMFFWIQIETQVAGSNKVKPQDLDFSSDLSLVGDAHRKLALQDLRCSYFFIYFLLIGFFGTGNIASINTFDPSSILCFLTVFNPFVMGALMLWKMLIPLLLVSCAFNAIHLAVNVPTQSLFLLVILMSDFMGLHFFFLVRDYGSWLEIGTSISHYVIVMSMIFFLILLLLLSKLFTNVLLVRGSKIHGQ